MFEDLDQNIKTEDITAEHINGHRHHHHHSDSSHSSHSSHSSSHHHSDGSHSSSHHHHRHHRRHGKAKKVVLAVVLSLLGIILIGGGIAAFKGREYYAAAKTMAAKAEELKSGLNEVVNNIKKGDYEAADASILKVDKTTDEMRTELDDPKWKIADKVPTAGEDLNTARQLLVIVDEASDNLLKPLVKHLRENGLPNKKDLSAEKILSPEFAASLTKYADLIDTLCPAAEKTVKDFSELPEFKIPQLESKISKYRKPINENSEEIIAHLKFLENASTNLLRPVAQELNGKGLSMGEGQITDMLGPELAAQLNVYADVIEKLAPAIDQTLEDFGKLPAFKMEEIESKIGKYRKIAQNEDLKKLQALIEEAPSALLRPAADVMSKTPFSSFKTKDGIDVRVVKAYLDLAAQIKPYVIKASNELKSSEFMKNNPKIADKITSKLDSVMPLLEEFDSYKPLADAFIGDGSDKLYLVLAMNSAEIRACGGFPGSTGTITIKNGILKFGKFSSIYKNIEHKNKTLIAATSVENTLFHKGWYGTKITSATANPHFPRVAQISAAGYKRKSKVMPDGVIAMTPHIISRLIAITEPIKLSNGKKLDEKYSMKYLQRDIYFQYFKNCKNSKEFNAANAKTDALFAEAADKAQKNVLSKLDIKTVKDIFGVLKKASEDRIFMMWMRDAAAQETVKSLGYSGSLNFDEKKPEIGVYYSIFDANKLGIYVDLSVKIGEGTKNDNGTITYPVTVKLKNSIDKTSEKEGAGNSYLTSNSGGSAMRSLLYFFAPAGGSLSNFKSTRADASGKATTYQGLKVVYCDTFKLKPGASVTFTYKVTTAAGVTEKPKISMTPVLTAYRNAKAPK